MTNILIVDDEEPIRRLIGQILERNNYNCTLAANASEAHEFLKVREFELILCDMNMPGQSGLDFIRSVLAESPDTAAVMVTGMHDPIIAYVSLQIGVFDYVTKPFDQNRILVSVASALRRRELEIDNRAYRENLEKKVKERTASLQESTEKWRRTLEGSIRAMAFALEMRDPYTAGHQQRVADLACAIAKEMDLSENQTNGIRMAAMIHDIGKICIPSQILTKPGKLTEIEFALIKAHPGTGYDILKNIEFPWPIAQMVLQHHERIDGSGYPSGLACSKMLFEAKILGVADVVEAMASHRPYRPALGLDKALEEISKNRGVLYDPEVVDACLKVFREKGFEFK